MQNGLQNGLPLGGNPPQFVKKRKRGATRLSCAECRRLKLRCDRAIPCGSCVKRGCSAICPDGSLTTGKGNRSVHPFVLASTQELHEKIAQLSHRIRDLEDGLRQSHSSQTMDQHPLLSDDLLSIKAPIQRDGLPQPSSANASATDELGVDVVDSFGSLAISDTGRTNYFGQATSSWNESNQDERDDRLANLRLQLPAEILALSGVFPVAPNITSTVDALYHSARTDRLSKIYWHLPPAAEAQKLQQFYFTHAAWMYHPITVQEFEEQIFSIFYCPNAAPQMDDPLLSHQMAVMFMVLAIGCLMDPSRPAYNIEADKFHQLARAALFQSPIFEEPTLNAVQALYLMAFYLFLSERHGTGVGSRWAFMGLAVKLGVSVHRDAGRFKGVDPADIQRRREIFWELYSYDLLQSYTLGRPPSFSLAHVDCKKPRIEDPHNEATFHWWKHKFISECMGSVYDQAFGAKTPTYNTVLQLDRRLRSYPVPQLLQIAGFGSSDSRLDAYNDSVPLVLQRHTVLAIRESNLLYMHRGFFARAISDHPRDPLGSPYGTSFIAAYRSAGSLVALVGNVHSQLKELSERMWFLWTHLFSCAIILGSIVTKCPSMNLAPSALQQLDSACDLFSKTARYFRAENVLDIMLKLREKAHASLAQYRAAPPSRSGSLSEPSTPADDQDELSTFGGRTRLVGKKEKSLSPQIIDRSPTSLNPTVPFPIKPSEDANVHPYVLQYLRSFSTPAPRDVQDDHHLTARHIPPRHQQQQHQHQHQHQQQPPSISYAHQQQMPDLSPIATSSSSFVGGMEQYTPMDGMDGAAFPQYFPVFDYPMNDMWVPSPMSMDGDAAGLGYSPEGSTQTDWQDFVTQVGM
ncbi:hypothetical protein B0H21DRAFT_693617 [Amylocystis lapponica]|nr:hypothetical protein B0H21DRAFT_693617 [Amylocystis lapponica]